MWFVLLVTIGYTILRLYTLGVALKLYWDFAGAQEVTVVIYTGKGTSYLKTLRGPRALERIKIEQSRRMVWITTELAQLAMAFILVVLVLLAMFVFNLT